MLFLCSLRRRYIGITENVHVKCMEGKMKETLGNLANVRLPRVSGASEGAKGTLLENECVLNEGEREKWINVNDAREHGAKGLLER